jgi:hypothetical protein
MYLLKEKQRCLVWSLVLIVRDFTLADKMTGKFRSSQSVGYSRKLPISFPDVRTAIYSTCVSVFKHFGLYITPWDLAVLPIEDVQYYYRVQQTTKFSLKKNDLILNGRIFTNILMLQDNVKTVFVV